MAYGDDERKAFLQALENTSFIAVASKRSGVSRATIYRWMQEDSEFRITVKRAVRRGHDSLGEAAYSVLNEKVKEKNLSAARFVLTHYPSVYAVKQSGMTLEEEDRKEEQRDWRDMTLEERKIAAYEGVKKAFCDEDGNFIMSRKTAEFLIEEGEITREDIVGDVPDDPNDPARSNLTQPVPAHAVRVRCSG